MPTDCDRARESVSVQLDGELPEHELDRLETHLRFCPECAAWAENVRDLTLCLREASVEVPADAFVLPRHSRTWRVGSAVALGSAAAVVATMFFGPSGNRTSATLRASRSLAVTGSPAPVSAPRLLRLEDGRFPPSSAATPSFRHV